MRQAVSIGHFTGPATKATTIINKDGMSVIDKSEYCTDSYVIRGFLTQLIDLDSWNHSWHLEVSQAQWKDSKERKRVRQIMQEKIEQREAEIQKLKNGIQILGRWNMNID